MRPLINETKILSLQKEEQEGKVENYPEVAEK